MGLLGTSISVACGEGLPAAFKRLVREIMATKSHFLDIFNHTDKRNLIPSSIFEYEKRLPLFDQTSLRKSKELHYLASIEPISMTRLGVQVPILLVPAFNRRPFEARIPYGARPRSISVTKPGYLGAAQYFLLESNATLARFISYYSGEIMFRTGTPPPFLHDNEFVLIFYGIVNFWKSHNGYKTTNKWLFVTVVFLSRKKRVPAHIDVTNVRQVSGHMTITWLPSSEGRNIEISEKELRSMGMQVATFM